ncbi:hypothetical protein HDU67_006982 [Dinochytrium kinnereticum]|nr:hypothetical protein HDU67_006982 [Dinochytrium kinnereticum]
MDVLRVTLSSRNVTHPELHGGNTTKIAPKPSNETVLSPASDSGRDAPTPSGAFSFFGLKMPSGFFSQPSSSTSAFLASPPITPVEEKGISSLEGHDKVLRFQGRRDGRDFKKDA